MERKKYTKISCCCCCCGCLMRSHFMYRTKEKNHVPLRLEMEKKIAKHFQIKSSASTVKQQKELRKKLSPSRKSSAISQWFEQNLFIFLAFELPLWVWVSYATTDNLTLQIFFLFWLCFAEPNWFRNYINFAILRSIIASSMKSTLIANCNYFSLGNQKEVRLTLFLLELIEFITLYSICDEASLM